MEKEKNKKEENIPILNLNLTFEDGVMLMTEIIRGLFKNFGERYSEVEGVIDDINDELDDIVNNKILLEGYLYPRADEIMERFGIDTDTITF